MGATKSRIMPIILIVAGTLICFVSLFADFLGIGGESHAMGWKQWAGVVTGLVIGMVGLVLSLRNSLLKVLSPVVILGSELFGRLQENWRLALAVVLLIVVVTTALLLRVQMVDNALPYPGHVDEPHLSERAGKMLKTGDFSPHIFRYPCLPLYVTAAGLTLGYLDAASHLEVASTRDIGSLNFPYFSQLRIIRAAKILFAVLSVCTMFLMGTVARRTYGNALLLVLVPFIMLLSSTYLFYSAGYLNVDVVGAFTVALSYTYLLESLDEDTLMRRAIVPGILSGMVISSKYPLFWIVVPFMLAILLYSRERRATKLLVLVAITFLSALAFNPFILVEFNRFLDDIAHVVAHYARGHAGHEGQPGWSQFERYIVSMIKDWGWGVFGLVLVGILATFEKNWKHALILISFPLLLLLFLSKQVVWFVRNSLAVYPFWALYAAIGVVAACALLSRLLEHLPFFRDSGTSRNLAVVLFLVVMILALFPAHKPIAWARSKPDSRIQAVGWVRENLPPGSRLVVPEELSMDTRPLEGDYEIVHLAFKDLWEDDFYAKIEDLDDPYILMPRFGYDARKPGGQEVADRLNSFAEAIEPLESFAGRKVLVNYSVPVPHGNPAFSIGQVKLTEAQRRRLDSRIELDLASRLLVLALGDQVASAAGAPR